MRDIFRSVVEIEGGQPVRYRVVQCRCGAEGRVKDSTATAMPAEMVERALRRLGWGRVSPKGGICPACTQSKKQARAERAPRRDNKDMVMTATTAASSAAEPPRTPTTDEKRRIREELFAHYLEDKGCWAGDRSDRSVADALKVPFAWVAQMRDALGFGPDENEAATAWTAEIAAMRRELAAVQDRLLSEAAKAIDPLMAKLAAMEKVGPGRGK